MYSQNFPKFKEFFESHCFQRTYYFHIFKCDFSDSYSCPYHDALVGSTINQFPDPIPYSDPSGVEHCEEGKYLQMFLPSKLIDIIKRKSIVSFSAIGQTALNVRILLRCSLRWFQLTAFDVCTKESQHSRVKNAQTTAE